MVLPAEVMKIRFEEKYLVLKRKKARELLGKALAQAGVNVSVPTLLRVLQHAMALQGHRYFVVNLDEGAGREAMKRYFESCARQVVEGELLQKGLEGVRKGMKG